MIYVFGDCSLDVNRRELRRGADCVLVEPQVFDLLNYLIAERDRVVSKEDIIDAVWGGRIVSDSTVSSRTTLVRQAIGDSGKSQRLIRTIPRKGLQFVGEVGERQPSGNVRPAAPTSQAEHNEAKKLPTGSANNSERRQPATAVRDSIGWAVVLARFAKVLPALGGLLYLIMPIDLISAARYPVVGHLDELVFVLIGAIATYGLTLRAPKAWKRPFARMFHLGCGIVISTMAVPILRLAIARWPTTSEVLLFRNSWLQPQSSVPGFVRALFSVPAARRCLEKGLAYSGFGEGELPSERRIRPG